MKKIGEIELQPKTLGELMERHNGKGLGRISLHFLVIFCFAGLVVAADSLLIKLVVMLLLGICLVFLFAPLHESIHKTAFKSPWLNTVTGWVCGFILFLPPRFFQAFHMAHHRHTQIADKDPELSTEKPKTLFQYLIYLSGIVYWKEQILVLLCYAFGDRQDDYVSDNKIDAIRNEARLYLLLYILIITISVQLASSAALTLWILPVVMGQPLLRAYLLAEHSLCPLVKEMHKNTRTTLTNRLIRGLCWNMNYHAEHHALPAVPFHKLPDFHQYIKTEIDFLDCGYVAVHRQIRSELAG